MTSLLNKYSRTLLRLRFTRRDWLRLFLSGWALSLMTPFQKAGTAAQPVHGSVLQKFLGERLLYKLGFWLFPRCGEARASVTETGQPGLYRASLEGQTTGFVDWLVGQYRFAYVSYMTISKAGDRFLPHHFLLSTRRMGKERHTAVTFDYAKEKIIFSRTMNNGETQQETTPMQKGIIYEDYMTLFYNFRNGSYGPLKRGRTYHLPIHVHQGMKSLEVTIASREEEEKQRQKEINKAGKDLFLRFRVHREDVSSVSGEIEGWLSLDAVPVKGTIKDVVLFGDLWGELVQRQVGGAPGVGAGAAMSQSKDIFSEVTLMLQKSRALQIQGVEGGLRLSSAEVKL